MNIDNFLHIYFWVYLIASLLLIIGQWGKKIKEEGHHTLDFWSVVGIVIFIISFKY